MQFYETYVQQEIVSSLRTQLQNTDNQNTKIMSSLRTQFEIQDIRNTILTQLAGRITVQFSHVVKLKKNESFT